MEAAHLKGKLLVATPALGDPNFLATVVLVIRHDDQGAVGVVLNDPTALSVIDHVPDWAESILAPEVVFRGGPVEPEVALALSRGPAADPAMAIIDGVQLVDLTGRPATVSPNRIFAGYSGWGHRQLEHEVGRDDWIVVDATEDDVFTPRPADLWRTVLERHFGDLGFLRYLPRHPSLN